MKKVFWIFSFCALSITTAFSQDENYYTDNSGSNNGYDYSTNNNGYSNQPDNQHAYVNYDDAQSYQNFYDQLSPYGNWVSYAGYGYVWVPTQVDADFTPYATGGHWVYTDYGWTWASDYDWGWAAFHYGRWFRDAAYGWMWMPGTEWAPAWVNWGSYDNYYCWAPMAPYASFGSYYRPEVYSWNFVDRDHFCRADLGHYLHNRDFHERGDYRNISAHINIINESHHEGNHVYAAGPRVNDVEHVTGHIITPMTINNVSHATASHISGNQISLYRPQIRTNVAQNVNGQFHQQANMNQAHSQSFDNRANVQTNHFANNNVQSQVREQQFNRVNTNMEHGDNNRQYQRSNNQAQNMPRQFNQSSFQNTRPAEQYNRPAIESRPQIQNHPAQSYQAPQRNFEQHSQPVQRQNERSFASAQSFSTQQARSFNGGGHAGRR